MTTKTSKTSKTSKPTVTKPAFDKAVALAHLADSYLTFKDRALAVANAAADFLDSVKELRAHKVKLGDVRTCENAKAVMAAMPESLNPKTKANYLSEIRKAVNDGAELSLNSSRDKAKAKAKGGKGGKAKTGTGNILISIGKGAKPADAAEKLLKGFNAMKSANDELAGLAAFLIDAIADAKAAKFKA